MVVHGSIWPWLGAFISGEEVKVSGEEVKEEKDPDENWEKIKEEKMIKA